MQHITLLLLALFAFTLSAFAAPLPSDLEKRITHTGRVSSLSFFFVFLKMEVLTSALLRTYLGHVVQCRVGQLRLYGQ